uniref:Uncharacterized protein n=1 Tax=Glossina palpalis gambiensis TaxID=67801 RepID=A0A1B0C399_9MUSC
MQMKDNKNKHLQAPDDVVTLFFAFGYGFYIPTSVYVLPCYYCDVLRSTSTIRKAPSVVDNTRNVLGFLDIKSKQRDRAVWDFSTVFFQNRLVLKRLPLSELHSTACVGKLSLWMTLKEDQSGKRTPDQAAPTFSGEGPSRNSQEFTY